MLALVLDMDGTLVASSAGTCRARPHLVAFLEYVFRECGVVGIWTAASPTWYELVYTAVLRPALVEVSARLGVECSFSFVWTYRRCTHTYENRDECVTTKRLHKLWRRRSGIFRAIRRENTLVVDDTASTFAANYGNAIHVREYDPDADDGDDGDDGDDDELLMLQRFIALVLEHYTRTGTVRTFDKRRWRTRVQ